MHKFRSGGCHGCLVKIAGGQWMRSNAWNPWLNDGKHACIPRDHVARCIAKPPARWRFSIVEVWKTYSTQSWAGEGQGCPCTFDGHLQVISGRYNPYLQLGPGPTSQEKHISSHQDIKYKGPRIFEVSATMKQVQKFCWFCCSDPKELLTGKWTAGTPSWKGKPSSKSPIFWLQHDRFPRGFI